MVPDRPPIPPAAAALAPSAELTLPLPPGYRAEATLRFLGRDAASPCERVDGNGFVKALRLGATAALLAVELEPRSARCRLAAASLDPGTAPSPLVPADVAAAAAAARRLLGLAGAASDPAPFERQARAVGLGRLVAGREGLRIPLAADPFEGLVWAILGQQVNVAFAATLRRRLVALCGAPLAGTPFAAHPSPAAVAALGVDELLPLQLSRRKAEYLLGAARAVAAGELPLDRLAAEPPEEVEARLLARRGIGPWTANYVMLRALGFADCAPVGDTGLAAGLVRLFALDHRPGAEETLALLAPLRPYRSLATAHLWASLGDTP